MKTKQLTENEINYNVYNALNLYSKSLGELYLNQQFNPFEENFYLNEEFVTERYTNSLKAKQLNEPEFLIAGTIQTKLAFKNSLNCCNQLLSQIEILLNDQSLSKTQKENLKKLKEYLLCRIALLNLNLESLKKNKNTLKMYLDLQGLNWNFCEVLDETYYGNLNMQVAINQMLLYIEQSKQKLTKSLKDKAQEVIQNNLKIEQTKSTVKETNSTKQENNKNKYNIYLKETKNYPQKQNIEKTKETKTVKQFASPQKNISAERDI